MEQLVLDLTNPLTRENALLELSKKRESFPELAPFLWHSFGTISALLQEIVSIYPLLSPPSLTAHASNRVCNALALLQCVASHLETRSLFLQGVRLLDACCYKCWVRFVSNSTSREHCHPSCVCTAHVPLFLYPFLNTSSKTRPFEYLRLTSLGVIGALVKASALLCLLLFRITLHLLTFIQLDLEVTCTSHVLLQVDDTEVINFLLSTEIIPLCLRTMEMGSELSKTVATFIVQKILLDNVSCSHKLSTSHVHSVQAQGS